MEKTLIHPTAIIENGAELAADVEVGAYAYIGPMVRLGPGCRIQHHATVEGNTSMGSANEVFPYALVGGRTQDKKWTGDEAPVIIGDNNIFREFCTVHPATFADKSTRIGSGNLFCAYSHIGQQTLLDLLKEKGNFFPFRSDTGAFCVANKVSITHIRYEKLKAEDEGYQPMGDREEVMITFVSGCRYCA